MGYKNIEPFKSSGINDLNFLSTDENTITGGSYGSKPANILSRGTQYNPTTGDSVQSSYGYNGSNASNIVNKGTGASNNGGYWDGKKIGDNTGGMSSLDQFNTGINMAVGIGNMVSTFQQNRLAKDTFNFNKKNINRNYQMTKDAYDQRLRRGRNISRQLSGESYADVHKDQVKYDAARDERMKDV